MNIKLIGTFEINLPSSIIRTWKRMRLRKARKKGSHWKKGLNVRIISFWKNEIWKRDCFVQAK